MSADQPKPRFEPPPWEQEAFKHFRKAQDEATAREELDAALKVVRGAGQADPQAEAASAQQPPKETPMTPPTVAGAAPAEPREPTVSRERIPESRVDLMLIQLRGEERPVQGASRGLITGVMAFMSIVGLYIIIRSALLFRDVEASEAASTLLAGTLSFVVLLTGLGFLGGAFLLFRKYYR